MLNDIILIGSWCLVFYRLIFEDFHPLVRTTDIDFYVPNPKRIDPGDVASSLKKLNYDHVRDSLTDKSTFISPTGFEIEFLTNLTKEGVSSVRLGFSQIYAESLSYVQVFADNCVDVDYFGLHLKVASPAVFVIQKILIQDRRGLKGEKDKAAIAYVASFLPASRKMSTDFYRVLSSLPLRWKRKVLTYFQANGLKMPDDSPAFLTK